MASREQWVGVLMVTTALTAAGGAGGRAAEPTISQTEQSADLRRFDIPAQSLADALPLFGRQAGLQVSADAAAVSGVASPGVKGAMAPVEALRQLLAGTGATWRFTDARTVVVEKAVVSGAMELAPVTVAGTAQQPAQAQIGEVPPVYHGGQVARGSRLGVLGNRDIMDTPFSTTSYTAELIQNQQARTLADVLENDPSVRFTTPGGHVMENFNIRGFDVSAADIAVNGMYGLAPYGHVPLEFAERVEVLRGPSALLTGIAPDGSVGGLINLVPKRAGDKPQTTVTADYTSGSQYGGHVDAGRRFGADNAFGARINAVHRDGETGVDGQEKGRDFASLALDYRGDRLRLSFDGYMSREEFANGSPFNAQMVSTIVNPPVSDTNMFPGLYGMQDYKTGVGRAEYDFNDHLTGYASFGVLSGIQSGYITSTHVTGIGNSGWGTGYSVFRNEFLDSTSAEAGLRGNFTTGDVGHEVVLGATRLEQATGFSYIRASYATNIYNPTATVLSAMSGDAPTQEKRTLDSVALADTMSFLGDRVQATVGIRRQQVDVTTFDNGGNQSGNYDEFAFTPAMGLVVKPVKDVSLYANYVEGLTKGQKVTNVNASNYGQVFAPFISKQFETGVKAETGTITNTLSLFQIQKNTLTNSGTLYTEGVQRNRGVEWNVFGEIQPGLRALGGLTYISSKMIKHANKNLLGNEAYGVPNWRGVLGVEWDPPVLKGLTLEARALYTGEQYVNSTNTLRLTDWWRFDLGARYVMDVRGTDVAIRAYATNIFDQDYWVGSFSDGYLTLSEPRTFMVSTSVTF
ncbi:MAG: TonB-dependent receptor [Magnetospirillum gryphiswaldense]|nr:TonB-dependent receptor [Magnetospirillum gryphiswaldense]